MTYQDIVYEKQGKIARVIFNRPEKLNALSARLLTEYASALTEADADKDVRTVIVKGAGRAFSVGYDVEPGKAGEYGEYQPLDDLLRMQGNTRKITTAWNMHKPVIAQVHGYCIAGGNDIAGQCDIIIAAENAVFQHPQVRRLGVTWMHLLAYHVGPQWAKMMVFTGDPISGKEAAALGLAARAVPAGSLESEVNRLAERIALVPEELLAVNKFAINRVIEEMGMKRVLDAVMALDVISHRSKPVQEFRRAAEEKGLKNALADNEAPFRATPRPF